MQEFNSERHWYVFYYLYVYIYAFLIWARERDFYFGMAVWRHKAALLTKRETCISPEERFVF